MNRIPRGASKAGANISCTLTYAAGETIAEDLNLREYGGWLELSFQRRQQTLPPMFELRHFGGMQWYVVYPKTGRKARVLFQLMGAAYYATKHACGRRAAYASQFPDPIGWAWHTKAKVKARLLGNADPDERDPPLRPTGIRWATCEKWEAGYNAAEDALDLHCGLVFAQLMGLNAMAPQVIGIAPPPAGYKRHFERI